MTCPPRYATRRRAERETFGGELAAVATKLGQPLMPWQRLVADVGCEIDPESGGPAYREVRVTIPRQSGKTTLFLSWQINRCVSRRWKHPQRSAFTAQTGKDARDKWIDELFPLIRTSKLKSLVAAGRGGLAINEGMGNESIRFKTGSIIRLLSSSASSGHSKTLHQAVMDEVWHDTDYRREQGLRPAMITVGDAQLLVCSTAGTAESLVLNEKVETGRQAVLDDTGFGVAYFEWSAPDGWDPDDWESYFGFSPALCPNPPCRCAPPVDGWRHTITLSVLKAERASMELAEFKRAYGNVPTGVEDIPEWTVFKRPDWMADPPDGCRDPDSAPQDPVAFSIITSEDLQWSTVCVAGQREDGLHHVEVAERLPGTAWVVPWVLERRERWRAEACRLVINKSTPAGQFIAPLQEAGVEVTTISTQDAAAASGQLLTAVESGTVRHRGQGSLNVSIARAAKREFSKTWELALTSGSTDVSPGPGCAYALWGYTTRPATQPFFAAWR